MKEITLKEPKYKYVKAGFLEKTIFETEDGKKFNNKKEAEIHENELAVSKRINKLKTVEPEVDIDINSYSLWYYVEKEEDIPWIIQATEQDYVTVFFNGEYSRDLFTEIKVGDWVTTHYTDGGDSRGRLGYYTLKYIKQDIKKFLDSFK